MVICMQSVLADSPMLHFSAPTTSPVQAQSFSGSAWQHPSSNCCPNALSELLLEHMLDCHTCLSGSLDHEMMSCPVYEDLQAQIALCGRPSKPLVFAY